MKKLILLTICLIAILCTSSAFAAVTLNDVKNTKYEEPVNMLITLGLVNGYEDSTYRPDNIVSRGEMAKLMVIALGKEADVSSAKTRASKFKDLSSDAWEFGYVMVAADNGIINGYPDGTFGSDNTVTYAEATAMLVRALGFEEEASKSSDVWPSNYVNVAKKYSLYKNIGTVTANEGAKRGNIALLLWNTLRTGTSTVVGQNDNGLVYGNKGEKLLNKSLSKFLYLENATVTSVKFADDDYEKATVKFVGEKSVSVSSIDGEKAASMYGQKYNLLYNNTNKKIEYIEESDDNDIKKAEIEKITASKVYLVNGNSKGYSLPDDDNILYYGIESKDEAVEAQLVFDGSEVEYVTLYAPDKVTLALVLDSDVTVSKKDGIEIINYKASSSKKYALAEDEKAPDDKDIILYYLNSNNEIIILKRASLSDAKEVTSASSKKIKLGSKEYKYESTTEYQIAQVNKQKLSSYSVSSIEDDEDCAIYMTFGNMDYFIVYVGGTEEVEKELASETKTAKSNLKSYITKAEAIDEKSFTQATYAPMAKSLETAKTVYDSSSSSLSSVKNAYSDLKEKYEALKKISTLSTASKRETETEIVTAKAELRAIVNGTDVTNAVKNKSTYTTASYKTFNTALTTAKDVLNKTSATLTTVENATKKLKDGLNGLVSTTTDTERKAAVDAFNTALTNASKVGAASTYTKASYDNFKAIWDEAKKINTATAAIADIKSATTKLNNAIDLLEKTSEAEESDVANAKKDLLEVLYQAQKLAKSGDSYTTASLNKLTSAITSAETEYEKATATAESINTAKKNLNTAISGLVKIDEKLAELKKKANSRVEEIATALALPETTKAEKEAKISALKSAIDTENATFTTAKSNLESKIAEAEALTAEMWTTLGYTGEYSEMQAKLTSAKNTLKVTNVTSAELLNAFKELNAAMK